MKRLIVLIALIAFFAVSGASQSLFKPVPKDLLAKEVNGVKTLTNASAWLWRFSAAVTATELTWDKSSKKFVSAPLSSVGPAIGYRHYVEANGVPYNDFGVNAALLLGTDINNVELASMKLAILLNAFQFVNVGACYTFNNTNHFGILLGASVNF